MAAIGRRSATALALLGVVGFSLTLPATRIAGQGALSPTMLSLGRAVPAAAGAALLLTLTKAPRPRGTEWARLVTVAAGVVVGFPLLTALALRQVDAGQAAVLVGMLPAATLAASAVLHGQRASARFWLASGVGLIATMSYIMLGGHGATVTGKLELLAAVALAGVGYAEGGALARRLSGPAMISWALVAALPLTLPATAWTVADHGLHGSDRAWLAFAYVSSVSMLLAFFAWYTALAHAGAERVSQIQLVQPGLTLVWSAVLVHERPSLVTITTAAVIFAAAAAVIPTTSRPRRRTESS
jgi:drug/metabolite transporter (DMT)-like permease